MRKATRETLTEMGILIVDDETPYLEMTKMQLETMGFKRLYKAGSGQEALDALRSEPGVDMILSDVNMVGMDGIAFLREVKGDPNLQHIPVIMISGVDGMETVIQAIEEGAEDYLHKPIKEALLWARVCATLERKHLRDRELKLFAQVEKEKKKSEEILYNLIPESIVMRLRNGEQDIAEIFSDCTVLFADIVGFTSLSAQLDPSELVRMINTLFHAFDRILELHNLEKIKTNGDNYIVVGGLPPNVENHADRCIRFASQAILEIEEYNRIHGMNLQMRIGLNTGPVVAGIVGKTRFSFDMWGDTVNLASRMESLSPPNRIHMSASTRQSLNGLYQYESRGEIEIKGIGRMETFLLSQGG